MAVRGVRGATSILENTKEEIIGKTREMLEIIINKNEIMIEDIASAVFSVTDGIDAEFPAVAARKLGWVYTPLMCTNEIPVAGSLKNCIRVLLHINSEKKQDEMIHIYLYDAEKLRPDLNGGVKNKYYTSEKT